MRICNILEKVQGIIKRSKEKWNQHLKILKIKRFVYGEECLTITKRQSGKPLLSSEIIIFSESIDLLNISKDDAVRVLKNKKKGK